MVSKLNKDLKLIAKSSFIVFLGLALSKVLVYVFRIIVARHFGPEVYGLFALSLMISGWFITISLLGLYEGILRYIPMYRGKKQDERVKFVFGIITKVQVVSGIVSGVLLFFLYGFIAINIFDNENLVVFLKVFSFVAAFSVISSPFITVLRAYEKIGWYSFISSVGHNILKVLFIVIFIVLGFNSNAVSFSFLIGTFGTLILAYFVAKYKLPRIFSKSNLESEEKSDISKEVFSYSLPLLFSSFLFSIFHWVDSFSIGYYKGALEVGFYNAAIPIAMLLTLAPEFFMKLFYPIINKEYSRENIQVIRELSKQVGKWIFIINLPLFIILFIFPEVVLNILFGSEYTVSSSALRLLSISSFMVSFTGMISHKLVTMIGKSKLVLFNVVIAGTLNVILNILLVPMEKILFCALLSNLHLQSLKVNKQFLLHFRIQRLKYAI